MSKKYIISEKNAAEIKEYHKGVTEKYLDRRLHAVQLLGEGMKPKDIAKKLDADKRQISRWAAQFC
ncbi:MAG: helix-turn-helix domain-containing protein, partial [Oscillospiraceae bacterium]|nr:helix-turn-helix domain-containing protein [Oscillospiraceae bacterium]